MRTNTCCTLEEKKSAERKILSANHNFSRHQPPPTSKLDQGKPLGRDKNFYNSLPIFFRKLKNLNQFADSNHEMYYAEMVRALTLARRETAALDPYSFKKSDFR